MKLKAADIMTPHVVVATPDMSIRRAGKIMNKFRIGGLPVVDKNGKLISIVTERCIMKNVIATNRRPSKTKVKDVMVRGDIITASPGDSIKKIAQIMNEKDVTRIPLQDEKGNLVGIVSNKDVIENSPALTDLIVEQAQMQDAYDQYNSSVSFGECEKCGKISDLFFKKDKFVCDECADIKRRKKSRFNIFKR